ncbi:MAG: alpha/beta hydrolase [Limosilactobacillus oris]|jgi:acetyl esterase/lipase|uniref:alpha/beta hydrolase n=1 Tax=Limosilactobacillus oris TaxID=1632 RepID=UPI0017480156|nr:alpha/beta hydrolase [Limosilactobacillus oris]MBF0601983.1 alpha/beta hydrolase [Limosilactobacillus oris]MCH3911112.1 alpha/beta hydrolase [Limosilactobacillus oris]MCH3938363.1 alpha/beta hydrolase [Limosilactobacillus oris]MCI1981467.1 alpha/beta hydrolase [Limosilactobacillus oris]MCI2043577.1 alpha/beta hydrolase [Limosilactobacillus oris]
MAIHEIENNPGLTGQVRLIDNVTYAAVDGRPLKMAILEPWTQRFPLKYHLAPRPLIVFVQGSSWRVGKMGEQIPQLVQFVKAGYVVATVQHRNTLDGYPFPAFLEDVKTAIRYLRRRAVKFAIDPDRVTIWGTSSGANAAMLVGLTGDDPRYAGHLYRTESDRVNAVVSCFAPMDVLDTFDYTAAVPGSELLKFCLLGMDRKKWPEIAKEMSPLDQVKPGQDYPPFLLFHGDADKVVPYQQMVKMYDKLEADGYDVAAYRVKGANHEKDFWSERVYQTVLEFLDKKVK